MATMLLDFCLDMVMLAAALRFCGRRIHAAGLALGAAAGVMAAQAVRCWAAQLSPALWLPTAWVMLLFADREYAIRHPVRSVVLLLASGGLLGGTIQALQGATGSRMASYLPAAAAFAGMVRCVLRTRRVRADRLVMTCCYNGRRARFEAIGDSGNTLVDYLTHRPVIVVPRQDAVARLSLEGKALRPIFAETAGGRQMMWCFSPEAVYGENGKKWQAVVALSPGLMPGAPALVPAALLGGGDA